MNILLTGRDGQLGRALAPQLARLGRVTAMGRAELDLGNTAAIAAALDHLAPDLIVNAAAHTQVDRAESESDAAFAINAHAPAALAAWAARHDRPLVHYSTDYVFDGSGTRPWREDDPTGPLNVYGTSKLAGEQAIRASGAPHLILRTSWVYDGTGRNFLRTMLRLGAAGGDVAVVADQFGAPTPTWWLAQATRQLIGQTGGDGGTLHLCCGGETSWYGFACEIFNQAQKLGIIPITVSPRAISTADFPTPARRPANSRLDLGCVRDLGIAPPHWTEALQPVMTESAGLSLVSSQSSFTDR